MSNPHSSSVVVHIISLCLKKISHPIDPRGGSRRRSWRTYWIGGLEKLIFLTLLHFRAHHVRDLMCPVREFVSAVRLAGLSLLLSHKTWPISNFFQHSYDNLLLSHTHDTVFSYVLRFSPFHFFLFLAGESLLQIQPLRAQNLPWSGRRDLLQSHPLGTLGKGFEKNRRSNRHVWRGKSRLMRVQTVSEFIFLHPLSSFSFPLTPSRYVESEAVALSHRAFASSTSFSRWSSRESNWMASSTIEIRRISEDLDSCSSDIVNRQPIYGIGMWEIDNWMMN